MFLRERYKGKPIVLFSRVSAHSQKTFNAQTNVLLRIAIAPVLPLITYGPMRIFAKPFNSRIAVEFRGGQGVLQVFNTKRMLFSLIRFRLVQILFRLQAIEEYAGAGVRCTTAIALLHGRTGFLFPG